MNNKKAIINGEALHLPLDYPKTLTAALGRSSHSNTGIHIVDSGGNEEFLSYRELYQDAIKIACAIRKEKNQDKTIYLICADDLKVYFRLFWGCMLANHIPVTIADPSVSNIEKIKEKLLAAWKLLGNPSVLCTESTARILKDIDKDIELFCVEGLDIADSNSWLPEAKEDDKAFIQLSSGSTGEPKAIIEKHISVIKHTYVQSEVNAIKTQDTSLNWLPMDHVVPLLSYHCRDVILGINQVHVDPRFILQDPIRLLRLLEKHQVNITWMPNFGFRLICESLRDYKDEPFDLSSVRVWMNAGEQVTFPVLKSSVDELLKHNFNPNAIQPVFGTAEVATCITYNYPFNIDYCYQSPKSKKGQFVSLGPPCKGMSIRIVSDEGVLNEGEVGELEVFGDMLFPGYLYNPVEQKKAFTQDSWFKTGDLAFIKYGELYVTGRLKEEIIIRGVNYHCHEIEDIVHSIDGVRPSFVAAVPAINPTNESEELAIFFVPTNKNIDKILLQIRKEISSRFGVSPKYIIPLEENAFPKTTSGKIQRNYLRKNFSNKFISLAKSPKSSTVPPSKINHIPAQILIETLSDLLKIERVSLHSNFFEIGGDSLIAIQWQYALERKGFSLSIADIAKSDSLENLVKKLEKCDRTKTLLNIETAAQTAMKQVRQEGFGIYTSTFVWLVESDLDTKKLKGAWENLYHEIEFLRQTPVTAEKRSTEKIEYVWNEYNHSLEDSKNQKINQILTQERKQHLSSTHLTHQWAVYRLAENKFLLAWSHPHFILDGWAVGLVIARLLEQIASEKPSNKLISGNPPTTQDHINQPYWENIFSTWRSSSLLSEVAGQKGDPKRTGYQRISATINFETYSKVKALARRNKTSASIMLHAVLAHLLGWYCGKEDIVFGSIVTARSNSSLNVPHAIGNWLQTIPLRIKLGKTWKEAIKSAHDQLFQTYDPYKNYIKAVSDVLQKPDASLFDVLVVFEHYPDQLSNMLKQGSKIKIKDFIWHSPTEYPLTVIFEQSPMSLEHEEDMKLYFDYNAKIFSQRFIKNFSQHFKSAINSLTSDFDNKIHPATWISSAEMKALQTAQQGSSYHFQDNINQEILDTFTRYADRVAIKNNGEAYLYREILDRAKVIAAQISLYITPENQNVIVYMPRSPDALVCLIAIWLANSTYVYLDPKENTNRKKKILEITKPTLVLSNFSYFQYLLDLNDDLSIIDIDSITETTDYPNEFNLKNSASYMLFTSGTTDEPKAILQNTRTLLNLNRHMSQYVCANISTLQYAQLSFDVSLQEIIFTLLNGGTLIIVSDDIVRTTPLKLLNIIVLEKVTHAFLPPITYNAIADVWSKEQKRLPSLSHVFCSGEQFVLSKSGYNFSKREKFKLINQYGPTETHVALEFALNEEMIDKGNFPYWAPIGYPIANTKIELLNELGQTVPNSVIGEVFISGAGVAERYHHPISENNRFVIMNNRRFYKTGDKAYRTKYGLIYSSRTDEQVQIQGHRLELSEIRHAIMKHPIVLDCAVIHHENNIYGFVRAKKINFPEISIKDFISCILPTYAIPKKIFILNKFPITKNGKIDLKNLQTLLMNERKHISMFENPTEKALAKLWSELLLHDNFSNQDSFFNIGGNSLLLTSLIFSIETLFGVELDLKEIYQHQTIFSLSKLIEKKNISNYMLSSDRLPGFTSEKINKHLPVSHSQKRIWIRENERKTDYTKFNVPIILKLDEPISSGCLIKTIEKLCKKHEVLSWNFDLTDDNSIVVKNNKTIEIENVFSTITNAKDIEKRIKALEFLTFGNLRQRLFKFYLLSGKNGEHYLIMNFHHMIVDARSVSIILKDLQTIFTCEAARQSLDITQPPSYCQYILSEQQYLQSPRYKIDLDYWRKQLLGAEPAQIPYCTNSRKSIFPGAKSVKVTLKKENFDKLKNMARKLSVSDFSIVLSALYVLLSRYNSGKYFLAVVASTRPTPFDDTLGCFINALPVSFENNIANQISGKLIERIHEKLLEATAHQHCPFDKILEELSKSEISNSIPTSKIAIVYENALDLSPILLGDVIAQPIIGNYATPRNDITIYYYICNDSLVINFEFNSQLYTIKKIKKLSETLIHIMEIMTEPSLVLNTIISNLPEKV